MRYLFDYITWNINRCKVIFIFPPWDSHFTAVSVSQKALHHMYKYGHLSAWQSSFEIQSYKRSTFLLLFLLACFLYSPYTCAVCVYMCPPCVRGWICLCVCCSMCSVCKAPSQSVCLFSCPLLTSWCQCAPWKVTDTDREAEEVSPAHLQQRMEQTVCCSSVILTLLFLSPGI